MKQLHTLLLAGLLSIQYSCKKKDDSPSKADLLTREEWSIGSFRYHHSSDPWQNVSGAPCEYDNKFIFSDDHTYETNEGATKCNNNDPQIADTGTWAFNADETSIIITISNSPDTMQVAELTADKMVLTAQSSVGSDMYYIEYTFVH